MKVSALIFLCIIAVTMAVAIPVQSDHGTEAQLTLADLENEQKGSNYVDGLTDENQNVAREKRFILKKLALAKLAHLGLGALGITGAALATKGLIKSLVGDFGGSPYSRFASPRVSVSYPTGAYYHSQYYR